MEDIHSNITECMEQIKQDEASYNYLLQDNAFIKVQIGNDIIIFNKEQDKGIINKFTSYFKDRINLHKEQLKYELGKEL